MARVVAGLVLAAAGAMTHAADDGFKELKGPQIATTLRGKYLTDHHHWGHHYLADGRVMLQESGHDRPGKWFVQRDQLCLLKPHISRTDPTCYAVMGHAGQLRYEDERRRVVYQGFVRGHADAHAFDSTGRH